METFENLVEHTFFSALFGGAVFMLMGCITWFFPPKNINALYGYRTKGAMQSQERWEFAQKFSSIQMIKSGAVILVLSPLGYFFAVQRRCKRICGCCAFNCRYRLPVHHYRKSPEKEI